MAAASSSRTQEEPSWTLRWGPHAMRTLSVQYPPGRHLCSVEATAAVTRLVTAVSIVVVSSSCGMTLLLPNEPKRLDLLLLQPDLHKQHPAQKRVPMASRFWLPQLRRRHVVPKLPACSNRRTDNLASSRRKNYGETFGGSFHSHFFRLMISL
jgi:hypothetical protein